MNQFVYRETPTGQLEFVGDFEGLYQAIGDPWDQSGGALANPEYFSYYRHSRRRLVERLSAHVKAANAIDYTGLEIGCGHGHVMRQLNYHLQEWILFDGMDISATAIATACRENPEANFTVGDITDKDCTTGSVYDVVLLCQILWYVMHKMDVTLSNCWRFVRPGGWLVVSQAFLKHQRYGREMIDGFNGLVNLFASKYDGMFQLLEAHYDDQGKYIHNDGLVILRRI